MDIPFGPRRHFEGFEGSGQFVGVTPGSSLNNMLGLRAGVAGFGGEKILRYGRSVLAVISSEAVISKMACACGEAGDSANTTAQLTPIWKLGWLLPLINVLKLSVWVLPVPAKSPVRMLAEQSNCCLLGTLYCRTAATWRSVTPSLFNTVNSKENLATTWP